MPRITSSGNTKILSSQTDILELAKIAFRATPQLPSIVDFAESTEFLGSKGRKLYPRQKTLLKLMYLETENMTDYDTAVIDHWANTFDRTADRIGVSPDVWDRVSILKQQGFRHFREIVNISGRRGGKGHLGAIIAAYETYRMITLDDPQFFYGVAPDKDLYLYVTATNIDQARKFQFADVLNVIRDAPCFRNYIAKDDDYSLWLRTPSDFRRIAEFESMGMRPQSTIATLRCEAVSSNSSSSRGAACFAAVFDEMAHMLTGTGGTRTAEEIYNAITPALDQFGKDGLIYIPTSPYCLAPETRVLTEELKWVPVGTLQVGNKLIGFDENLPGGKGNGRSWRQAEVTETSVIQAPRYKVKTSRGTVISTDEHMWLSCTSNHHSGYHWRKTKQLKPGNEIRWIPTWEDDDSKDAGYLSGFFDGEGYISTGHLGASQNPGAVLDKVLKSLKERDFDASVYLSEKNKDCYDLGINGGTAEVMRFLGSIGSERLMTKFYKNLYGTRAYDKCSQTAIVESVEYLDEGPVVALGTSTSTLIAEGMFSHNTKIGKAYTLYEDSLRLNPDGTPESPNILMIQLPSWSVYEDWDDPIVTQGQDFRGAPAQYNEEMRSLEKRDPVTFRVERLSQWAEVIDAFLDPATVDHMYDPFMDAEGNMRVLQETTAGQMRYLYRGHCDPSETTNNTACIIAHTEKIKDPQTGDEWHHIVTDWIKLWRPRDFPDHQINWALVEREIADKMMMYPTLRVFSYDQFGSFVTVPSLKRELAESHHRCIVKKVTFTSQLKQRMAERLRAALGMGWVHCYPDKYGDDQTSLLADELKFWQIINGRIKKQETGPIVTDDIGDCLLVVVDELLEDNFVRLEMRDRLGSTKLLYAGQGGYSSQNTPYEDQSEGRKRLSTFSGSMNTNRPLYAGMGNRLRDGGKPPRRSGR